MVPIIFLAGRKRNGEGGTALADEESFLEDPHWVTEFCPLALSMFLVTMKKLLSDKNDTSSLHTNALNVLSAKLL